MAGQRQVVLSRQGGLKKAKERLLASYPKKKQRNVPLLPYLPAGEEPGKRDKHNVQN